ncbi:MAG: restriction endonuclease [SAR324 cluster bacterium]|nr:restriction endonuclease [SAR324 cluster bacterium]
MATPEAQTGEQIDHQSKKRLPEPIASKQLGFEGIPTIAALERKRAEEIVRGVTHLEDLEGMTPEEFEDVCVFLFASARNFSGRRTRRAKDDGLDGIGLDSSNDLFAIQAKRTKKVGVKKIREFVGAMVPRPFRVGYFLTTGTFTAPARKYAQRSPNWKVGFKLRLIDANALLDAIQRFRKTARGYETQPP